jgi:hypothetical protein
MRERNRNTTFIRNRMCHNINLCFLLALSGSAYVIHFSIDNKCDNHITDQHTSGSPSADEYKEAPHCQ